jgi:hypothetical protein
LLALGRVSFGKALSLQFDELPAKPTSRPAAGEGFYGLRELTAPDPRVDAASAGALEQRKRPVVSVKHHLLRLAWIGKVHLHLGADTPLRADRKHVADRNLAAAPRTSALRNSQMISIRGE